MRDVNHAPPAPGKRGRHRERRRTRRRVRHSRRPPWCQAGSRAGSEKGGSTTRVRRPGSDRERKGGSRTTSPTSAVGIGPAHVRGLAEGIEEAGGTSDGVGGDGAGCANPPGRVEENLDAEHDGRDGRRVANRRANSGSPRGRRAGTIWRRWPRRRSGGGRRIAVRGVSLDFRVKGRILEDKTLRLRLKIGDASGHTRTVEFPFNTDTDSSYSVASEMVDELQLSQSDIRTIMNGD